MMRGSKTFHACWAARVTPTRRGPRPGPSTRAPGWPRARRTGTRRSARRAGRCAARCPARARRRRSRPEASSTLACRRGATVRGHGPSLHTAVVIRLTPALKLILISLHVLIKTLLLLHPSASDSTNDVASSRTKESRRHAAPPTSRRWSSSWACPAPASPPSARRSRSGCGVPVRRRRRLPPAGQHRQDDGRHPLDDDDRRPWLETIGEWLADARRHGGVMSCSALKRRYRDQLRGHCPRRRLPAPARRPARSSPRRVASRPGHFMPASLVASQFATLEPLAGRRARRRSSTSTSTSTTARRSRTSHHGPAHRRTGRRH